MSNLKKTRFYNTFYSAKIKTTEGKILWGLWFFIALYIATIHLKNPSKWDILFIVVILLPFTVPLWRFIQEKSVYRRLAEHEKNVIAPSSPYDFTLNTSLYKQFDSREGSKTLRSLLLKSTQRYKVYDLGLTLISGNSSNYQTEQYHTVFEGSLSREVPNILFDSHLAHGRQFRSYLVGAQRIPLDANLGDYYDAYVPNDYRIDVLRIVGPEVLYAMREFELPCDVELVGKSVVCYAPLIPYEKIDTFEKQCVGFFNLLDDTLLNYRDDHTYGRDRRFAVHGFARELLRSPFYRWPVLLFSQALFMGFVVFITVNQLWDEVFLNPAMLIIVCSVALPEPILCVMQWRRNNRSKKSFEASQRFITARQAAKADQI